MEALGTVRHVYDELGRLTGRQVVADNSTVLQAETYAPDGLNRLAAVGGDLGTVTLGYTDSSGELASLAYPAGAGNLTATLAYFANNQGRWLQALEYTGAGAAVLARHEYTHRADGSVASWRQGFAWAEGFAGPGATQEQLYTFGYDASGWLTGATLGAPVSGNGTPTVQAAWAEHTYGYDDSGNRNVAAVNGANLTGNFNGANQVTTLTRSGTTRVAGTTSEPARVAVEGAPTKQWAEPGGAAWAFEADLSLSAGPHNITVQAVDGANNTLTNVYTVQAGGAAANFTYNANGDMTQRVDNPGTGAPRNLSSYTSF